ncbi:MFS transporter [Albimonas sp. CAU 1670]|uniref:MFS transporter n=1 Tax=Albimonas sp. CAU 1670 TaxID=3032599 RepID=UPI0023DAF395|nr:MFS transporter [Albimonas sp. CAU 1670]MDF2235731.1 MFS transporter [Albimonas sp. CAU 1670]
MSNNLDRLDAPHVRARMTAVLTVVTALSVFLFSFVTLVSLDRAVAPELQQRTRLIGVVVRDKLQDTLSAGIPIRALAGLETYLGATMDEFSEIRRISVVTARGELVAAVERPEAQALLDRIEIGRRLGIAGAELQMPILVGNELVGQIRIVSSAQFVEARIRSVMTDASMLALAAILIGVELTLVVASRSIWQPLRAIVMLGRQQAGGSFAHTVAPTGLATIRLVARRLNDQAVHLAERASAAAPELARKPVRMAMPGLADMRLALFAFVAATEVTASFLPVFARGASRPEWLDPGLAAAAPSMLYLAVLAILAPLAGRLVARLGPRTVFAAASVPAAVALVGMAATDDLIGVIACRGAIAICYGFATIACQDYALALRGGAGDGEGARVSAVIMAMVFGGTFCGANIGGIFADRYGYDATMMLGAALAVLAGLIGWRGLAASGAMPPHAERSGPVAAPSRPVAFYAFLFGIVAPMNLVTAICIWYITPLRLAALGASPAEIARVVMLFYLFQLVLGPVAVRLAGSRFGLALTMVAGAAVAASSLAAFGSETFWLMTGTVAGVGAGLALVRGPALEFAAHHAASAPGRLHVYRVVERSVALVGLLAAASVIGGEDNDRILGFLSLLVFVGLLIFSIAAAVTRRTRGGFGNDGVEAGRDGSRALDRGLFGGSRRGRR